MEEIPSIRTGSCQCAEGRLLRSGRVEVGEIEKEKVSFAYVRDRGGRPTRLQASRSNNITQLFMKICEHCKNILGSSYSYLQVLLAN